MNNMKLEFDAATSDMYIHSHTPCKQHQPHTPWDWTPSSHNAMQDLKQTLILILTISGLLFIVFTRYVVVVVVYSDVAQSHGADHSSSGVHRCPHSSIAGFNTLSTSRLYEQFSHLFYSHLFYETWHVCVTIFLWEMFFSKVCTRISVMKI